MATDLVKAVFSGATPGSDLGNFAPATGSGFARHPSFAGSGVVATADGRFRAASANADTVYFNRTAPPGADYSVRLKVTAKALTDADIIGPAIRCAGDSDNFYTLSWIDFSGLGYGLAIFKHVKGSPAKIAGPLSTLNGASVAPAAGTSALLEIAVAGRTITGYYNGAAALTVDDPDLTGAGFGGFYVRSGAVNDTSGLQAEEFYVNDSPTFVPAPGPGSGGANPPAGGNTATIAVAGVGHWCSPLNWDDDGSGPKQPNGVRPGATAVWSANPGAHGRFRWTTTAGSGNVAALQVDAGPLVAGSVPADQFPKIKYRINDGAYRVAQVQAGTNGAFALDVTGAGVSGPGDYTLRYHLMASSQDEPRWSPPGGGSAPAEVLRVKGLVVDAGSTPAAPAALPRTLAVFGDSITEGVRALGTEAGDLASNDSTLTFAQSLAAGLGAELAAVGFGAQGWTRAGNGGVPAFPDAFASYSTGRARDFSRPVDYVLCVHGANDGLNGAPATAVASASAAWLAAARSRFGPAVKIFLGVPFGGFARDGLAAGFAQYQAKTPDASAFLVDGGPALQAGLAGFNGGTFASVDGVHPDGPTHARVAAVLLDAIADALAGPGQSGPASPAGPVAPSGATFAQLRAGGLSGQIEALIRANPALDPDAVDGLRAGRTAGIDRAYRGLVSLVEAYLRGDPIATADVNARLADYAAIFAVYAQAAAEVAALAQANPGTIANIPNSAHAINPIARRSFD